MLSQHSHHDRCQNNELNDKFFSFIYYNYVDFILNEKMIKRDKWLANQISKARIKELNSMLHVPNLH